jgi:hypothetical protein
MERKRRIYWRGGGDEAYIVRGGHTIRACMHILHDGQKEKRENEALRNIVNEH